MTSDGGHGPQWLAWNSEVVSADCIALEASEYSWQENAETPQSAP